MRVGRQCRKLLAQAPDVGAAKGRGGAKGGIKPLGGGGGGGGGVVGGGLKVQRAAAKGKGRGHTREGGREGAGGHDAWQTDTDTAVVR